MSDYTQVNAGAMQQGISDLQTAYNGTSNTLDSLERELESSLAQWDGGARAAYSEAKARWDQAANPMAQVLQKRTPTLSTIDQNYASNEQQIASNWA